MPCGKADFFINAPYRHPLTKKGETSDRTKLHVARRKFVGSGKATSARNFSLRLAPIEIPTTPKVQVTPRPMVHELEMHTKANAHAPWALISHRSLCACAFRRVSSQRTGFSDLPPFGLRGEGTPRMYARLYRCTWQIWWLG